MNEIQNAYCPIEISKTKMKSIRLRQKTRIRNERKIIMISSMYFVLSECKIFQHLLDTIPHSAVIVLLYRLQHPVVCEPIHHWSALRIEFNYFGFSLIFFVMLQTLFKIFSHQIEYKNQKEKR